MNQRRQNVWNIDAPYPELWAASGVQDIYLELVNEGIAYLRDNLADYDSGESDSEEHAASIEMLAYTTTELLAQFCSGGFRWYSTDKARFLSPTVDPVAIFIGRTSENIGHMGSHFASLKRGVWDFLDTSERTGSWLEAMDLDKQQISYLLWAARKALRLLRSDERIPGFTNLVLSNSEILDGYRKCESPIESILYMQLVSQGLRPPILQCQFHAVSYRVDFAIPDGYLVIECDGKQYHDPQKDAERDRRLSQAGWTVIRFRSDEILMDPSYCSAKVYEQYPWTKTRGHPVTP